MSQEGFIGCHACEVPMTKDGDNNYRCTTPGCGRGYMAGPNGVSVVIDDNGVMTITGGPKSTNGQADKS